MDEENINNSKIEIKKKIHRKYNVSIKKPLMIKNQMLKLQGNYGENFLKKKRNLIKKNMKSQKQSMTKKQKN